MSFLFTFFLADVGCVCWFFDYVTVLSDVVAVIFVFYILFWVVCGRKLLIKKLSKALPSFKVSFAFVSFAQIYLFSKILLVFFCHLLFCDFWLYDFVSSSLLLLGFEFLFVFFLFALVCVVRWCFLVTQMEANWPLLQSDSAPNRPFREKGPKRKRRKVLFWDKCPTILIFS